MSSKSNGSRFNDVRDAFKPLSTPDKATFVIEATFNTLGEAIRDAATQFGEAMESFDVEEVFSEESTVERENDNSANGTQES